MGSQDLFTIAYLSQGIAAVIGCVIAAFVLEEAHPKWVFLGHGCYGFVLAVATCFLSTDAEREFLVGEEPDVTEWSSEFMAGQT